MKKIKYIIIVVLAFVCAWSFTSCKKDGVFNPDKKISKIFYNYGYGKQLDQIWTWNGKLLEKVTYSGGGIETLSYNGKRQLTKRMYVGTYGYNDYTEFSYDGRKLSKIACYEDGKLLEEGIVTHNGNKITKIEVTSYSNFKSEMSRGLLSQLFFDNTLKNTVEKQEKKMMSQCAGKAVFTYTFSLTWEKDNIKKTTFEFMEHGIYYNDAVEYSYDKKDNPYYRNLSRDEATDCSVLCGSKNNVTNETYYDNGIYDGYTSYTYTYDDDFPTVRISNDGEILYFEYE